MTPAMPGEPNGTSHRRSEITPAQTTELPSMLATITRSRHFIFGRPSPSSSGGILSISKFMAASCHEKGCMATGKLASRSGSPMYCLWREKQRRRKGQTEPVLQHPTLQMLPHCNGRQVSADRPEWISAEEQIAYRPAAVGKSTLSQVERPVMRHVTALTEAPAPARDSPGPVGLPADLQLSEGRLPMDLRLRCCTDRRAGLPHP
jgi:hypothetical protein